MFFKSQNDSVNSVGTKSTVLFETAVPPAHAGTADISDFTNAGVKGYF